MPIDLSQVDWLYVALLAIFVFVTAYVGGFLAFGRRWIAALASTVLFVALFVFWTYYPHRVPGPRAISLPGTTTTAVPAPAAPAAPTAPQKPRNPVTDVTPPAAPAPPPAVPATPPAAPAPSPAAPAPPR
jgi:hypothetical protein